MRDTTAERELLEREMLAKPVSSLQYMLRQLSRTYQSLPRLVVDGVFGERTLEAVMRFQREAGLPVTGVVDQATWNAIRDAWLSQQPKTSYSRATRIFPSEGIQVHEGETKEYLIVPQTMFNILAKHFEGIILRCGRLQRPRLGGEHPLAPKGGRSA